MLICVLMGVFNEKSVSKCARCSRTFKDEAKFTLHKRRCRSPRPAPVPVEKPKFVCAFCDSERSYVKRNSLIKHIEKVHGRSPIICYICECEFIDHADLNVHRQSGPCEPKAGSSGLQERPRSVDMMDELDDSLNIPNIQYESTEINQTQQSDNAELTETIQVPQIGNVEVITLVQAETSHLSIITPEKTTSVIPCKDPTCSQFFSSKSNAQRHFKSIHVGERVECGECRREWTTWENFEKHLDSCPGKEVEERSPPTITHTCPECGKSGFVSETNVRRHIDTVHNNERPHKCDRCGRGFTGKYNLCRHLKMNKCSSRVATRAIPIQAVPEQSDDTIMQDEQIGRASSQLNSSSQLSIRQDCTDVVQWDPVVGMSGK